VEPGEVGEAFISEKGVGPVRLLRSSYGTIQHASQPAGMSSDKFILVNVGKTRLGFLGSRRQK
jgi:hypothetical protein